MDWRREPVARTVRSGGPGRRGTEAGAGPGAHAARPRTRASRARARAAVGGEGDGGEGGAGDGGEGGGGWRGRWWRGEAAGWAAVERSEGEWSRGVEWMSQAFNSRLGVLCRVPDRVCRVPPIRHSAKEFKKTKTNFAEGL